MITRGGAVKSSGPDMHLIARTAGRILMSVMRYWLRNPAIITLAIATGLRTGAGLIWVAYTASYFSELWTDNGNACTFSYNATASASASDCDGSYAYCRDGLCSAISSTPWHNQVIMNMMMGLLMMMMSMLMCR